MQINFTQPTENGKNRSLLLLLVLIKLSLSISNILPAAIYLPYLRNRGGLNSEVWRILKFECKQKQSFSQFCVSKVCTAREVSTWEFSWVFSRYFSDIESPLDPIPWKMRGKSLLIKTGKRLLWMLSTENRTIVWWHCSVVTARVYVAEAENIYLIFWNISQCVNLDKIMLKLLSVQFESIEAWPGR